MTTAVLFVQNTTVNNITSFHDQISNEFPKILDQWSFELKIYRTNPIIANFLSLMSRSPQIQQEINTQTSKILYTLSLSYVPQQTISIIDKNCTIFNTDRSMGESLIDSGCSTGFYDSLDSIIQNKLNGSWLLKQTLKGEGGNSYEVLLDNGDVFIIRTANCFLHGSFKGFLIEITYKNSDVGVELAQSNGNVKTENVNSSANGSAANGNSDGSHVQAIDKIKDLIKRLHFPAGKLSAAKLDETNKQQSVLGDLAFQYTQASQF